MLLRFKVIFYCCSNLQVFTDSNKTGKLRFYAKPHFFTCMLGKLLPPKVVVITHGSCKFKKCIDMCVTRLCADPATCQQYYKRLVDTDNQHLNICKSIKTVVKADTTPVEELTHWNFRKHL